MAVRRALHLPLLLLLLAGPVPAAESPSGSGHPAVGRVERVGFGEGCVGTLVGPRQVLTAAHCLLHPRNRLPLPPHQVRFQAGGMATALAGVAAATGSGYRGGAGPSLEMLPRDWAVLVLAAEAGVAPLPLRARSLEGLTGLVGAKVLRPGHRMGAAPCALANIGQDPALLLHDCPVTGGDSGAPLIVGEGEAAAVLAIQVAILSINGRPHHLALSATAFADGVAAVVADPAFAGR
ncbi:MAG: hypothetical protein RLY86_389 [Pseudomonadota bacterium]|jgi:protease YdgD